MISKYNLFLDNRKVIIIDSLLVTISNIRDNEYLTHIDIFKNILHVPKLSTNITNVKRLVNAINCKVIIDKYLSNAYNKVMNKKIGHIQVLYYFGASSQGCIAKLHGHLGLKTFALIEFEKI